MADYPIIADVSQFIVKTLREKMCPEPIPSPNNIEISSPTSQDVDYLVGVYLYDIREEAEVSTPRYIQKGRTQITKPPLPYSLYYMVFIKIIGKIAQIVNDNNSIYPNELQNWLDVPEPPIVLSQAKISLEEKERVWRMVNKPYQISLFYRAAPVYLSSGEFINTPRVSDASFEIGVTGEERG